MVILYRTLLEEQARHRVHSSPVGTGTDGGPVRGILAVS